MFQLLLFTGSLFSSLLLATADRSDKASFEEHFSALESERAAIESQFAVLDAAIKSHQVVWAAALAKRAAAVAQPRPALNAKSPEELQLSPLSVANASHCRAQGAYKGNVNFRIADSFIELAIAGLPSFLQVIDRKSEAGESHIVIGNASANSKDYSHGAEALARSAFASDGAKRLSHLLHSKGFNGGSAPCTYPFHMLMKNLVQASRRPPSALLETPEDTDGSKETPEDTDGSKETPETPEDTDGTGRPTRTEARMLTALESNELNASRIYQEHFLATSEKVYKVGQDLCPAIQSRHWKCRKTNARRRIFGSTGAFVEDPAFYTAKTGYEPNDQKSRRRRFNPEDPLEGEHGDIQCLDWRSPEEKNKFKTYLGNAANLVGANEALLNSCSDDCVGLCGAGCDCWESICGSNYRCNYNPVCCAHDQACCKHGYMSIVCLNAGTVRRSCDNTRLKILDGR